MGVHDFCVANRFWEAQGANEEACATPAAASTSA
jgi:hypothetical protein